MIESVVCYPYRLGAHLSVSDEDAADFLQSQFTNELRPYEAGQCTYGLWLDVKGKVLGDSSVLCEGRESFRVISTLTSGDLIKNKLEQNIIADDVLIESLPANHAFTVIGAQAEVLLEAIGLSIPSVGQFSSQEDILVFRGRRSLNPAFELIPDSEKALSWLKSRLAEKNVPFVDRRAVEQERMAAGIPLVPVEIGPKDLAGEGGLEQAAISFTKGCYLGQEVVARLYNLGQPQRALFKVSGQGSSPDCPLPVYNDDSKLVGEVRTAIQHDTGWIGVALLKKRFVSDGATLMGDGNQVRILHRFNALKDNKSS